MDKEKLAIELLKIMYEKISIMPTPDMMVKDYRAILYELNKEEEYV